MAVNHSLVPAGYAAWLTASKKRIAGALHRATLSANQELLRLYHHIGAEILTSQQRQRWGAKVIDGVSSHSLSVGAGRA